MASLVWASVCLHAYMLLLGLAPGTHGSLLAALLMNWRCRLLLAAWHLLLPPPSHAHVVLPTSTIWQSCGPSHHPLATTELAAAGLMLLASIHHVSLECTAAWFERAAAAGMAHSTVAR